MVKSAVLGVKDCDTSRERYDNSLAMKLALAVEVLVEPLPALAGSSNEREARIHG